jgi:hypothetical protein
MSDDVFTKWAIELRAEMVYNWDNYNTPPVRGRNESKIVDRFKKLRGNKCDFLQKDLSGDADSLGIIKNFNRDASPINQFFPAMMKTKISYGKTSDNSVSIYDYFADPELEESFLHTIRRTVKRDSTYSWARSVVNKMDENPFWNGQSSMDFIKDVHDGEVFTGEYSNLDIVMSKINKRTLGNYGTFNENYIGYGRLFLTAEELKTCIANGWLNEVQLSNITNIEESKLLKSGKKVEYVYSIAWYDRRTKIFPKVLQVFRLSCGKGQYSVNFQALTAKWIYETYTSHINQDEPIHIYDSSAGWGGRIIGAMAARKKIHYVGTDPNSDNYINEIDKSRYDYIANFYNKKCIDNYSDTFSDFFEVESESNTYETFLDGSELIANNPDFAKYKGKFDISFTSPPYFNRERYGDVGTGQSWDMYSDYSSWRDYFLKPTLITIYEFLKNDRYILWNIADIKIGADEYYTLEQDSIDILTELGCEYKGKLKMLLTRMVGSDPTKLGIKNSVKLNNMSYKYEPIFVFYKP